jgi:hypothetical protein
MRELQFRAGECDVPLNFAIGGVASGLQTIAINL